MRLREKKKEIARQESLLKRSQATYASATTKDGPIARMALTRIANAEKALKELKGGS